MSRNDIYMVTGLVFLLIAHMFTRIVVYRTSNICGTTRGISSVIETNPLMRVSFLLGGISEIIMVLFLPSFIISSYILVRSGKIVVEPIMVDILVVIFLLVSFMDAFNDFSVFLGIISRGGG